MRQPDLILLHPPSVYDFRHRPVMFGPIADVVPSTAIFEMYPLGFVTIAQYLNHQGFHVRIVNLAFRMLKSRAYDPERHIRRLKAKAFGIDLHWLPHAQGSLEIARICKKYHPTVPVIFGGFSSSYFYNDLIHQRDVDFIIRGDSTEAPFKMLLESIAQGETNEMSHIPNLVWKKSHGAVVVNELTYVPETLDHYDQPYRHMIRSAVRSLDIRSLIPIHDWWSYPITAVMTCRGCEHACCFCGGSQPGLRTFGNRPRPGFRSPHKIVQDMVGIAQITSAPIFVVGDLRQGGQDYSWSVLDGLRRTKIKNHVVFELFTRASSGYFRQLADSVENFNLEMSPESHDGKVRRASGKDYSNAQLEETIEDALNAGAGKFDLFFMIGLPRQTVQSVLETVDYCERLLERFGSRLVPFISPLAPFIDPGSPIYENPKAFGYTLFYRSLENFREALLQPSWKYALSYETRWMNRDQIVEVTYEAALRLNRLKARFGLLDERASGRVEERIVSARALIQRIDQTMNLSDEDREEALRALAEDIQTVNAGTLCEEGEIKWPVLSRGFRFWGIFRHLLGV